VTASWKDVCRASIPVEHLPLLAELRGRGEIRVFVAGDVAWISWEPGSELLEEILVRRILPLERAALYTERDGLWYRLGERLPRFDVPTHDASDWPLLERAIFPEPVKAVLAREGLQAPIPVRVVRDATATPRPASGLRCSPLALAAWAERSTTAQLAALSGAWLEPGLSDGSEALVLVTGSAESLPLLADGLRFWGTELLVPLGLRPEPDLPASAIRHAAGAGPDELAVLDQDGIELIPQAIFRPLSRAAIRMIAEGDSTTKEVRG
jgi:MoxR-vWA-beta-propeller ternary system domain bpX2